MTAIDKRRSYIEAEARESAETLLGYLQENCFRLPVSAEDLRKASVYFDTTQSHGCFIEDGTDTYTKGRNGGRIILANANPVLTSSRTPHGEKVRKVICHILGILYVRLEDPGVDIAAFPETYPSANDPKTEFSLREGVKEKMERLTGKPMELDEKEAKPQDTKKAASERLSEIQDALAELVRRKGEELDPNRDIDFGYGVELSDIGYKDPDSEKLEELDDRLSSPFPIRRMSEEFHAARIIIDGRSGKEETWKKVLRNLLLEGEKTSIAYLRGIYNY